MTKLFQSILRFRVAFIVVLILSHIAEAQQVSSTVNFVAPSSITLEGYLGNKIDLCIKNRIMAQNVEELVQPFRQKNETRLWQTEFWGKWMISATEAYRYKPTSELRVKMDEAVQKLLATQMPDGYIGNYTPTAQFEQWDIWGQKYVLMGLLNYEEVTKNGDVALKAARRLADRLIRKTRDEYINFIETGNYRGMPSSSVLVPMVKLWKRTGDDTYRDYCTYIINGWETTEGPQLVSKALQGVNVADRFAFPKSWWSHENGGKAYEMMSCYEGLLEFYKLTGDLRHLQAVEKAAQNIMATEINVAGSGSAFECWYHGAERQTTPTYHTMETCVTTTWMKLCQLLLEVTGKTIYADALERTAYNAMAASMLPDGSSFSKYSPLEGERSMGEMQCGMNINCCIANGPRGWMVLPASAVMASKDSIFINLFNSMHASVQLYKKNTITITQQTTYPVADSIVILIEPVAPATFALNVRIPGWSTYNRLRVNGQEVKMQSVKGYASIKRLWKKGDRVVLKLDLQGKLTEHAGFISISRGPVLLSRDSRFDDGFVDQATVINPRDSVVQLEMTEPPVGVWMAFKTHATFGTNQEHNSGLQPLYLCDYASAGNSWKASDRYRVWLPIPLNIMEKAYVPIRQK